MKLVEYFLFRVRIIIKQLRFYKDNKIINIFELTTLLLWSKFKLKSLKKRRMRVGGLPSSVVGCSEGPCLLLWSDCRKIVYQNFNGLRKWSWKITKLKRYSDFEKVDVERRRLIFRLPNWALKSWLWSSGFYTSINVMNFHACWCFWQYFGYFGRSSATDVVKSLWSSSLEGSWMLVTKAFPGRCCGVTAVSMRLLKHQKTVVTLILNLHFY